MDLVRVRSCGMLKSDHGDQEMIKVHVNEMGIVMRFDSPADIRLSLQAAENLHFNTQCERHVLGGKLLIEQ